MIRHDKKRTDSGLSAVACRHDGPERRVPKRGILRSCLDGVIRWAVYLYLRGRHTDRVDRDHSGLPGDGGDLGTGMRGHQEVYQDPVQDREMGAKGSEGEVRDQKIFGIDRQGQGSPEEMGGVYGDACGECYASVWAGRGDIHSVRPVHGVDL